MREGGKEKERKKGEDRERERISCTTEANRILPSYPDSCLVLTGADTQPAQDEQR